MEFMTNGELQHSINETWQRVGRDHEGIMVDHLAHLLQIQRRRAGQVELSVAEVMVKGEGVRVSLRDP